MTAPNVDTISRAEAIARVQAMPKEWGDSFGLYTQDEIIALLAALPGVEETSVAKPERGGALSIPEPLGPTEETATIYDILPATVQPDPERERVAAWLEKEADDMDQNNRHLLDSAPSDGVAVEWTIRRSEWLLARAADFRAAARYVRGT